MEKVCNHVFAVLKIRHVFKAVLFSGKSALKTMHLQDNKGALCLYTNDRLCNMLKSLPMLGKNFTEHL